MGDAGGRERRRPEDLPPEARAEFEAIRERHRSPAYRAEEEAFRDRIEREGGVRTADGVLHPMKDPAGAGPEFGLRLRALREARGLSVEEVARASGIERSAVFKLEGGRNANPTVATLERYARALGGRIRIEFETVAGERPG